ncbi:GAF domain-containing serine/threonine-protein kinase [Galbitalea soli]|uniref:Protein kinase n=1 Tax=Galbitalea soli TaxID=1268042 RepID=A0A7C9PNA1_9MICO|nr:protein kinase [Galbitalea soli]NEM91366.1 protein kinase [Galbitalea soli]NYJ30057.1 serine/threonine protein kinase [Galbitalea soli]
MTAPHADASGRTLAGRYWLEEPIGQGGMATVYRARDETLGRHVAVKLFTDRSPDENRQETELGVLAALSHHAIANLLDAGFDFDEGGHPHRFFVMELVTGIDLHQRIAQGPLLSRNIAEIGYDLAEALEYVHARGVVHRDIKPSNVLLVDYNDGNVRARAKLTDFGIALSADSERFTREGATTGTAAYLSPEQASGRDVTGASDVYALGLVLLEAFTRRLEFPGGLVESAVARLSRDPVIPPELSPGWQQLLAAMTARDPAQRPQGADLVSMFRQLVVAELSRHREESSEALPRDEYGRMDAVGRYRILDTPPDGAFDSITALAARLFDVPVAIVSIVDHDRIWFKSHHGIEIEQIDRDPGLCASAIMDDKPWIIEDARFDPRAFSNPLVAGEFGLQFYAGVPLTTRDGHNLGTLCVLDFQPRTVTDKDIDTLTGLAAVVMEQLEVRLEAIRTTGELQRATGELQRATGEVHRTMPLTPADMPTVPAYDGPMTPGSYPAPISAPGVSGPAPFPPRSAAQAAAEHPPALS